MMTHGIVTESCSRDVPRGRRAAWELTPQIEAALHFGEVEPLRRQGIFSHRDGRSYVYFVGGNDTPVKIGFSNAPYERLAALQIGCWLPLRILARVEGTFELEAKYHRRWAQHRLSGEWFTRAPAINREIARLLRLSPEPSPFRVAGIGSFCSAAAAQVRA